MSEHSTVALALYQGWDAYQDLLIKAISPLTPEQLAYRAAPHLRSVGENCRHIIGVRARWCHEVLGLGDQAFAALGQWDRRTMPDLSASELVSGLQHSWQVLSDALRHWTLADLDYGYPNPNDAREPGEPEVFTRRWVIWHLIEHDIHHGGEISLILGMHGLAGLAL